jgi:hypothetical protein
MNERKGHITKQKRKKQNEKKREAYLGSNNVVVGVL